MFPARMLAFVVALLATAPCALAQDAAAPAPDWSTAVQTAVTQDPELTTLTPTDVTDYCPNYASLDPAGRGAFWSALLQQVAMAESGGDASRTHWLAFDGVMHRPTFRRGLFQISIEAAHSDRYNCAVSSGQELTTPTVNAACAARILDASVNTANAIAGAGRYWPSLAHADRRARIAAVIAAAAPCSG
ncbi:MAG TPA: hypothetical protein VG943_13560 [Caulobacterales bacterium]|nr:hypothetical protein [Caulobacterales bacterium]